MKANAAIADREGARAPEGAPLARDAPHASALARLIESRERVFVVLRYLLLAAMVASGISTLRLSIKTLYPPYVYVKDLTQEYTLAKAVLHGVDPYLPLPDLVARFIGNVPVPVFPHPTPHPPIVGLLYGPFAFLEYQQAAAVWLVVEVCLLIASLRLLLCDMGVRWRPPAVALACIVAMGWGAVLQELVLGQLQSLLLLILLLAWAALRSEKDRLGGVLLGLGVALKLVVWPVAVYLLLKRRWRAVAACFGTVVALNLLMGAVVGFGTVLRYYTRVGPQVAGLYRGEAFNYSLWTVGRRLFEGTGSPVQLSMQAPPLVAWPFGASLAAIALPLAWLCMSLAAAVRCRRTDSALGILLCASLLVSPVAWTHYLLLASVPMAVVWRAVVERGYRLRESYGVALVTLGLLPSVGLLLEGAAHHIYGAPSATEAVTIPFGLSLITLVPAVALIGLSLLLWHLDRQHTELDDRLAC